MTSTRAPIPQMEPWFGSEEADAVYAYMKEGGWITEFKNTEKFEQEICRYTGASHCVVVNNGTISLTLAAQALGIGIGDEVIVPNYTMIASPNSVKMIGAVPVFVDVEESTLCLDVDLLETAITPKTKAVMLVTANGRYPQKGIERIQAVCNKHGIALLEDAAQSLGSRFPDGTHMGLKGDVGSFSFSAPKIISTGQGGALVTNNSDIAHKLRRLKDFGRSGGGLDVHETIGFNFKFTEPQAVIGLEQMKKLEWRVARKKEILKRYQHNLEGVKGIRLFGQDLNTTTPWFIDSLVERRAELMEFLKRAGVGTRLMYPPINLQRAYQVAGSHPISELIGQKGLWLPSANQLTDNDVDFVTGQIRNFYK